MGSFWISLIGFVVAAFPLFWTLMNVDIANSSTATSIRIYIIPNLLSLKYTTMAAVVKEMLLCGIALGISSGLAWAESKLDQRPLGNALDFFGGSSILGAILCLGLFVGITQCGIDEKDYRPAYVKYLLGADYIFLGVILFYFASALQMRRIKDMEA